MCLPSASGPPFIVAKSAGVMVNVVPFRVADTSVTADWSSCAWNEASGFVVVMLPVTVSSLVMLSRAETAGVVGQLRGDDRRRSGSGPAGRG